LSEHLLGVKAKSSSIPFAVEIDKISIPKKEKVQRGLYIVGFIILRI
jgi:hypothetical protein